MADTKISDLSAATTVVAGDEYVLARSGTSYKIDASDLAPGIIALGGGGAVPMVAVIADQKSAATNGGTFTSGAWRTRDLNTEIYDPDGIVSISSNQFTLQAGTYDIYAAAPAAVVLGHVVKLYNVTDAADVQIGNSAFTTTANNVNTMSEVYARVTIASAKAFEVRHICETTRATDGFGTRANVGISETYTTVRIAKLA